MNRGRGEWRGRGSSSSSRGGGGSNFSNRPHSNSHSRGGRGYRQQETTIQLPAAILAELGQTPTPATGLNQPYKRKFQTESHKSRKDLRLEARQAKKQRKCQFHGKPRKDQPEKEVLEPETAREAVEKTTWPHIASRNSKTETIPRKSSAPAAKVPKKKDTAIAKRQLESLAEKNPNFFKLLKEQNLISAEDARHIALMNEADEDGLDPEEAEAERYARLLKLKDGKPTSKFAADGLDFLLEGIDTNKRGTAQNAGTLEDDEDMSDDHSFQEEGFSNDSMEDEHQIDDEESDESDNFGEGQSDESGAEMSLQTDEETESESEADADEGGVELPMKAASPAVSAISKAYIPPHLRPAAASESKGKSQAYIQLQRELKGLLNRLTDSNMESIVAGIEATYRNHSRHDVTEIIIHLILEFISNHANLIDSFVMTYAALICILFNVIGSDLGAHFIQACVEAFDTSYSARALAAASATSDTMDEMTSMSDKRCTNLITLIAYLYNFQVTSCILVYDLIRQCIQGLDELDVELLLRILRICGFQLRSDDPSALRDIIQLVKEATSAKMESGSVEAKTSRMSFMLETIMDLKNNRKKSTASGSGDSLQQDRLRKFVANSVKKRSMTGAEPVRCSLDDIRSVQTKGKWWVVGAAWTGHDSTALQAATSNSNTAASVPASEDLLRLSRAQKMNTDVRRSIFVVLMSSEDCVDAFERLLKLNLRNKQEREIARVLTHCCCQEKVYNPYYSLVAQKFCLHEFSFKITFQFVLWDALKEMGSNSTSGGGCLSLVVLKTVPFTSLSEAQTLFLHIFFMTLFVLVGEEPEHVQNLFARSFGGGSGGANSDAVVLKEGLQYILTDMKRNPVHHALLQEGSREAILFKANLKLAIAELE